MKSEDFLDLLNEIDSDLVEKSRRDIELYESSREGAGFRVEYCRKKTLKTVIVSAAATAAAMLGLFVLINVVKSGIFVFPDAPYTSPGQNGSSFGGGDDISTPTNSGSVSVSDDSMGAGVSSTSSAVPQPIEDDFPYQFDFSLGGDGDHRFSEPAEKTDFKDYAQVNINEGAVSEENFVHMAVYGEDEFTDENIISETATIVGTPQSIALTYTVLNGPRSINYLCGWSGYHEASVSGRWDP